MAHGFRLLNYLLGYKDRYNLLILKNLYKSHTCFSTTQKCAFFQILMENQLAMQINDKRYFEKYPRCLHHFVDFIRNGFDEYDEFICLLYLPFKGLCLFKLVFSETLQEGILFSVPTSEPDRLRIILETMLSLQGKVRLFTFDTTSTLQNHTNCGGFSPLKKGPQVTSADQKESLPPKINCVDFKTQPFRFGTWGLGF